MQPKRTTVVLLASFAFLILYMKYVAEPYAKRREAERRAAAGPGPEAGPSTRTTPEQAAESRAVEAPESAATSSRRADVRPMVAAEDERAEVLENSELRLTFSNVGATLRKAELLKHRRVARKDEPLDLLHHFTGAAKSFDLRNLDDPKTYASEQPWRVVRDGPRALTFVLEAGVGTYDRPFRVTKSVKLAEDRPFVDVAFSFQYLANGDGAAGTAREQKWRFTPAGGLRLDSEAYGAEDLQGLQAAHFRVNEEGREEFRATPLAGLAKEESRNQEQLRAQRFALAGSRRFVADLNTYFGVYCALTEMPAVNASLVGVEDPEATGSRVRQPVRMRTDLEFQVTAKRGEAPATHGVRVYFGPNDEDEIRKAMPADAAALGEDFVRVYKEALGFWGWIARAVLWLLHALHGITGNWGFAIVLMTCCVRLVLFPVNRRSQDAMRRHSEAMARIKPKLDELKEKMKDRPKEFAAAQMMLMKKEKVPMLPLGGCLPLFLQIPVFYGLFSGLRASIDLRQAPFLWVADLSQPDHLITFSTPVVNPMKWLGSCATCCAPAGMSDTLSGIHLLPLLMTAAWIVNQMLMPKPANETPEMAQQRKMMLVMPFMFGLMMYGYAAGLSLYWLTSSLVGIVESKVIKRLNASRAAAA